MIAFDVPPKIPLWTPARPAIIRAAADVPRSELDRLFDASLVTTAMFLPGFMGKSQGGNDIHTELLLHCEGSNGGTTFTDSSKNAFTVTPTSVTTSTIQVKFGTTSAYFGAGTNAKLSVPDNSVLQAQGNFTIDLWAYLTDVTTQQVLFSKINDITGVGSYNIRVRLGMAEYYISSNGTSFDIASGISMGSIAINGWHHLALTWDGSTYRGFVDGVKGTDTVSAATPTPSTGHTVSVGNYQEGTGSLNTIGYLDEIRFSTVARWTANFTPPTFAYYP